MRLPSHRSAALLIHAAGWPLLGLLGAARLGTWRHGWLLDLVDTWASYPLAGWPLLGLLALGSRSAGLAALSAAGAAIALDSARRVVGRNARLGVPGPVLRVLTANVLGGNPGPAGLIELIERERPDLVMLQEVRPAFGDELLERVGDALPYYELCPHSRFGGAALLSRWPLQNAERFLLCDSGHFCQRARVCVGGQGLSVFNIHLETPYEIRPRMGTFPPFRIRRRARHARDMQVEELIEMVGAIDGPVLVAGDFNTSAGSRPHRILLRHLRDAYCEAGHGVGHTFPQPTAVRGLWVPAPLLRIDYVFCRGLEPLRARTLPHRGSDHRAVLVELSLPPVVGRPPRAAAG